MDIAVKIGYIFLDLILPLAVGYWLRGSKLPPRFFEVLVDAVLLVVYPILGILSFWGLRMDAALLWLPVFGLALQAIPGALAYLRMKGKYQAPGEQGSYLLAGILSNNLTVGGLSVFILFGATGFAYVQLAVLLQSFLIFVFCFPLARYFQQREQGGFEQGGISWREILLQRNQLAVMGVFVGEVLNGLEIQRPAAGVWLVDLLVHTGAWLSLVPVGHAMDFAAMRGHWRDTWDMAAIKFIFTPAVAALLTTAVIADPLMQKTLFILACAPVAINAVFASQLHQLNMPIAMANFVLTNTVYLLVVYPLLFIWLR